MLLRRHTLCTLIPEHQCFLLYGMMLRGKIGRRGARARRVIQMKRLITAIGLVLAVMCGIVSTADGADYTGIISIDSVDVRPGQSIGVAVWLRHNNIPISAMALPIQFSNPDLTLDSISLKQTVWTGEFTAYANIDPFDQTAELTVLPSEIVSPLPSVTAVNGVVAWLFFTVAADAAPARTVIDSVFTDTVVAGDIHVYTRVYISDNSGLGVYIPEFIPGEINVQAPTSVDDDGTSGLLPENFALDQNYPNPFNPSTVIGFALPTAGQVTLDVYNILGQEVLRLVDKSMPAGRYEITFDGDNLPSGVYFYRLMHQQGTSTRKMVLLK
jgi:hypothetical protein